MPADPSLDAIPAKGGPRFAAGITYMNPGDALLETAAPPDTPRARMSDDSPPGPDFKVGWAP